MDETNSEVQQLKTLLVAKFAEDGRPLTQQSLHLLVNHLRPLNEDEREACLQRVLSKLSYGSELTVSLKELELAIGDVDGCKDASELVQVVDAFDVPKPLWDSTRTRFYVDSTHKTLFPAAHAKAGVLLARFQMVQQRVARNPRFRGRVLRLTSADGQGAGIQLTQVKALSATGGSEVVVLGMLRRDQSGYAVLADPSGEVRVDLGQADVSQTRGFVAEGSVLLLEGGMLPSGIFLVRAVLEPPLESRIAANASLYGLSLFGGTPLKSDDILAIAEDNFAAECRRLTFIAGCHLNDDANLQRLATIFDGYEGLEEGPPAMFVLIGPFFPQKAPPLPFDDMRAAFRALAAIISRFPRIMEHSDLVLVPAAGDPGCCGCLPQAPLLPSVAQPLRRLSQRVTLASNPCRIQFYTKQIVVFSDALIPRFQRQEILAIPGAARTTEATFVRACHSVLCQSHLSPFEGTSSPCLWQHDHALAVFPQPDVLVIACGSGAVETSIAGTRCIKPGQLSDGHFAALLPEVPDSQTDLDDPMAVAGEVELCEVPERLAADGDDDSAAADDGWGDDDPEAEPEGSQRSHSSAVDSEDDFDALEDRDLQLDLDDYEENAKRKVRRRGVAATIDAPGEPEQAQGGSEAVGGTEEYRSSSDGEGSGRISAADSDADG